MFLAGKWTWSSHRPLLVWGLKTHPKRWPTECSFWANRYLEIKFSKFSGVNLVLPPLCQKFYHISLLSLSARLLSGSLFVLNFKFNLIVTYIIIFRPSIATIAGDYGAQRSDFQKLIKQHSSIRVYTIITISKYTPDTNIWCRVTLRLYHIRL